MLLGEDKLKTETREKQVKIEELMKEMKFVNESCDLKLQDAQHQLKAKDDSFHDQLNLLSEKEIEI